MKNNRVLLVLLLLVLLFQQLPLRSQEIFNTGAYACTREKAILTEDWVNNRLRVVRKGQLWMGMYVGTIADLGFAVQRNRDKTFLFRGNYDHYGDPIGINDQIVDMDFSPDYILLLPGDRLTLYYHCQDLGEKEGAGHIIVNLWSFP
jgi:hypothetical protein